MFISFEPRISSTNIAFCSVKTTSEMRAIVSSEKGAISLDLMRGTPVSLVALVVTP